MKKYSKDGWYTVCGYEVYIEDGKILRGISSDHQKPTWVYRHAKTDGWDREEAITPDAFRAGVRRGTIDMF